MKAIINSKLYKDNRFIDNKIVIFDQHIISISDTLPEGVEVIDAKGQYLLPGFVDVHVHGSMGADVMDASKDALDTISKGLSKTGVTRFLATTMTMSLEDIDKAIVNVRTHQNDLTGAQVLGVHLEGPFINKKYKGAQRAEMIQKPSWKVISPYLDIIKLITLAVEEDEDLEFVKNNPGIKLSIGHTSANYETALDAYDLGVCHCTHCFNAMTGLHHREPGVVGAVFTKPYETEFIADGIHIHPQFLDTFISIIGKENGIMITDSMRAGGMIQGEYDLGGQAVTVDDTSARLADGTLAGSILTMDRAIRNMKSFTNLSLEEIIPMATINPALSIDKTPNYGSIKENNLADFVLMNEDLFVTTTIVNGQVVYKKGH